MSLSGDGFFGLFDVDETAFLATFGFTAAEVDFFVGSVFFDASVLGTEDFFSTGLALTAFRKAPTFGDGIG